MQTLSAFALILLIFSYSSFSQYKKEIVLELKKDEEIHTISSNYLVVLSKEEKYKRNYHLLNLDQINLKKFLFATDLNQNVYVKFSSNEQFIIFRFLSDEENKIIFYDINTGNLIELLKPDGIVVSASIFNLKKILYQFRKANQPPKIFLLDKTNNSEIFIDIGVGEEWSPNGGYFIIIKVNEEIRKKGKEIFRDSANRKSDSGDIIIYNSLGKKLISPEQFSSVAYKEWSPDSKKMILKANHLRGFLIIYFNESDSTQIKISKIYEYNQLKTKPMGLEVVSLPVCSPDSKYIFFIKHLEDGHHILESSLWSYNIETSQSNFIITLENHVKTMAVDNNYNIYIVEYDDSNKLPIIRKIFKSE